jgi:cell wall-associated NlpC family hydrolase
MAACVPSVRYVGGRTDGQRQQRQRQNRQASTEERQSDWLSVALREPEQDRQEPEQGARRQAARKSSGPASGTASGAGQRRLTQVVDSYIGVPYKYGGTTRRGFDCSGFASAVYMEVYGVALKRAASAIWKDGVPVPIKAARPGDLVFFRGNAFGSIGHVGIYMGNDRFAHSSTSSGVKYSSLKETYYARRFAGAKRML